MKKNNFIMLLAGFLVIAMTVMAYVTLTKSKPAPAVDTQIQNFMQQSQSDEIESIEEDVRDTNFEDIDKELSDIEKEINSDSF